jgi:hypothetical protein
MKHVAVWVMTDAEHSQHNNKLIGKTFRMEACLSEGGGYSVSSSYRTLWSNG